MLKRADIEDYYRLDATCYSIEIYLKPLTPKDFKNVIVNKIKYYCSKDKVSWLAVYSTTNGKTAQQTVIKTGKRGRPKKSVKGIKEAGHVHCVIKGTAEKSAYSTVQKIKKSIDKTYGRKASKIISKGNTDHAYYFMFYSFRQADIVRSGGDFDFMQYVKDFDRYNERELFS